MEILPALLVGAGVGALLLAGWAVLRILGSFLTLVIASFIPSSDRRRDRALRQS